MNTGKFNNMFFLFLLIAFLQAYPHTALGEESRVSAIREPILAGTWYPGSKDSLNQSLEAYLSKVTPESAADIKGIIVPHAGHIYSGQVAAYAYNMLKTMDINRIIMIGPSHRFGFRGVSVNLQSAYKTPLGTVPVDKDFAVKLINADDHIRYIPQAHAHEHSLEIQLPFLQTVLKDIKIVPIVMGEQDLKTCSLLADTLTALTNGEKRTLLLASSDLSHYHGDNQARELDQKFINHVKEFDPAGLSRSLDSGTCEACGGGPVCTVMLTSRALGADSTRILSYANSGDMTGDKKRVVGYMSAILFRSK